jgi:hypothetical protein
MKLVTNRILALGVAGLLTLSLAQAAVIITATTENAGVTGVPSFNPSWAPSGNVNTVNDVLLGLSPSAIGSGNFQAESSPGISILTNGAAGPILNKSGTDAAIHTIWATTGNGGGTSVTYTLTTATVLQNVIVYGGWNDSGRDEQNTTVSYSINGGATFISLGSLDTNPTVGADIQSAVRTTWTDDTGSFAGGTAITNLRFDFGNVENGYVGTAELVATAVAAPEPNTIALGLSGALVLGLCLFRRRIA